MKKINRRGFIQSSALGAVSTTLCLNSNLLSMFSKKKKYGIQLFTVPSMLSRDFRGTLKLISEIGFKEIEFFGPYPFSAPETIEAWKPIRAQLNITQNAFYGKTLKYAS